MMTHHGYPCTNSNIINGSGDRSAAALPVTSTAIDFTASPVSAACTFATAISCNVYDE